MREHAGHQEEVGNGQRVVGAGAREGVRAGDPQRRRRTRVDGELEALRRSARSVQVAEEAPERIRRRIDAAGEVERRQRLHVDDERGGGDLDAAPGQRLVDAGVERAIAVRPQPRIPVRREEHLAARRIAEEAAAEALVERRRTVGVADVAAHLGAARRHEVGHRHVAGQRARRAVHVDVVVGMIGAGRGQIERAGSGRPAAGRPAPPAAADRAPRPAPRRTPRARSG